MDQEKMKKLNADFAEKSELLTKEFHGLFKKWMKKNPRLTMLMALNMPINALINICTEFEESSKIFPDLPDVFFRMINPFIILKEKWGKVSNKEFFQEYIKIYESQFEDFFIDEEMKENFKKWHNANSKKKRKNI